MTSTRLTARPCCRDQMTRVPRPPRGREAAPGQLSRLLEAHEIVIREVRQAARAAADHGDDGTNDLLVSSVLRTNELQVWFLSEHLVDSRHFGMLSSTTILSSNSGLPSRRRTI